MTVAAVKRSRVDVLIVSGTYLRRILEIGRNYHPGKLVTVSHG